MTHCSDNQNKILLSLSNALFSCNNEIEIDDISSFINESILQGVVPGVLNSINCDINNPYFYKLEKLKNTVIKRNLQLVWEHKYVAKKIAESKIPYVILKGVASAEYYPNINLRTLGDVDVLIPNEYLQRAGELFTDDGYELSHENHERHIVLTKNSVRIELHRAVTGVPDGIIGEKITEYFSDIFDKSREYDGMNVPSEFHHLLILLLHTAHHIKENGIGLRHLCDFSVFVNRYSKSEYDRLYAKRLKKIGLYDFSLILSQISKECFSHPDFPTYENSACEMLLSDIFENGSFGNKNPVNMQQSIFSEKGLFYKANEIVCKNWKTAKKRPLLLPVGYLYFSARYICRSIIGKREKIDLKTAKISAEHRKNLYDSIELFKGE